MSRNTFVTTPYKPIESGFAPSVRALLGYDNTAIPSTLSTSRTVIKNVKKPKIYNGDDPAFHLVPDTIGTWTSYAKYAVQLAMIIVACYLLAYHYYDSTLSWVAPMSTIEQGATALDLYPATFAACTIDSTMPPQRQYRCFYTKSKSDLNGVRLFYNASHGQGGTIGIPNPVLALIGAYQQSPLRLSTDMILIQPSVKSLDYRIAPPMDACADDPQCALGIRDTCCRTNVGLVPAAVISHLRDRGDRLDANTCKDPTLPCYACAPGTKMVHIGSLRAKPMIDAVTPIQKQDADSMNKIIENGEYYAYICVVPTLARPVEIPTAVQKTKTSTTTTAVNEPTTTAPKSLQSLWVNRNSN